MFESRLNFLFISKPVSLKTIIAFLKIKCHMGGGGEGIINQNSVTYYLNGALPEFVKVSPSWFPWVVMCGCWMSETRVEDETKEGGNGAKVKVCGIPLDDVTTWLVGTECCGARATDTMLLLELPPDAWNIGNILASLPLWFGNFKTTKLNSFSLNW